MLQHIESLNADPKVHGIIVQMPLDCDDKTIDSHLITNSVDPNKDVDGLTTINEGKVATGDLVSGFQPCTPAGCMDLIKRSGVQIEGAYAVVIGKHLCFTICMRGLMFKTDYPIRFLFLPAFCVSLKKLL